MDPASEDVDSVLVIVEDLTRVAARVTELETRGTAAVNELVALGRRADLLARTNEELLSANHELTLANAELRSANEELLVGSEEVQAATEEVETLNEELQATNEELETLNEELQATVEELNTTNDDLEARSVEIETAAALAVDERSDRDRAFRHLARGLTRASAGVAILDRWGEPVLSTELSELLRKGAVHAVDGSSPIDGRTGVRERVLRGERVEGRYEVARDAGKARYDIVAEPLREEAVIVGAVMTMRPPPPPRRSRSGRAVAQKE